MAITFFTQSRKQIAPIWIRYRELSIDAKARTNLYIDKDRLKGSKVLKHKMSAKDNAVGIWEGETIRNGDISNNISYSFNKDRTGSKIVTVINHKSYDIDQKAFDFTYSFSNDFIVILYTKTKDSDAYTFKRYSSMITLDGKEYKK